MSGEHYEFGPPQSPITRRRLLGTMALTLITLDVALLEGSLVGLQINQIAAEVNALSGEIALLNNSSDTGQTQEDEDMVDAARWIPPEQP
ncbi:MAG TPA: hypothetical protein VFT87_03360 [Candidatus Saccharimonadales bacterium]|nr:hypothetical protein [Candidatus Saccharimonadales bacterium]